MHIRRPLEGVTYPSEADAALYKREKAWHSQTLGDAVRSVAAALPDKVAMVTRGHRTTYSQLDADSEAFATNLLNLGVRPGDRVMFQMGSTLETAIALLGCAKAAAIPVCALLQHRDTEINALAEKTRPKAYIVQGSSNRFDAVGFALKMAERNMIPLVISARSERRGLAITFEDMIRPPADNSRSLAPDELDIGDVLMLQLSGGTTSVPKLISRFHGEHLGQALRWSERTSIGSDAVLLYAMPLIHNAGLVAMFYPSLLAGGTFVLMERADSEQFFSLIEEERVTHSLSIGPAANKMLAYNRIRDHDLSSLRLLTNFHGSQAMQRHVGATCLNIYGITEGFILSSEIMSSESVRFETVGWPVSKLDEVKIVRPGTEDSVPQGETGEFCFRGPSSIRGYYKAPEINAASFTSDRYFRTGDLLISNEIDGRVCYAFRGRIKDNIDRGGEKFGAEEVEVLIDRHPSVIDVKIVAMPDSMYGEKACAFLILKPGAPDIDIQELSNFLTAQGLAKFKIPERVEIIDHFPVTSVGKVDKQRLREAVLALLAAERAAIKGL